MVIVPGNWLLSNVPTGGNDMILVVMFLIAVFIVGVGFIFDCWMDSQFKDRSKGGRGRDYWGW